jgi:hypothetical protein
MAKGELAVLWTVDQAWLVKEDKGGHHRWWDCGKVRFDRAATFCRDRGIELHVLQFHKGKPVFGGNAAGN